MPRLIAGDVVEMRAAIATEKGDGERWDLKYAAGGLIDLEFIAQYLQLVHAARAARHSRHLDRARARQGGALARAAGRGCRGAAPGGAALSGSHADPAAVPAGPVRSEDRRRRAAAAAGARRRRAGFRHARGAPDRDAGEGARELRADLGRRRRKARASGRFFLRQRGIAAASGSRTTTIVPCRASSGCACGRHAVRPATWRSRGPGPSPDGSW